VSALLHGAAVARDFAALAEHLSASTVAVADGNAGAGSGVIWTADGTIVTNAHVVRRRDVPGRAQRRAQIPRTGRPP
jgi:S1-C subfamily serine protease